MHQQLRFQVGQWLVEPQLNRLSQGDNQTIVVPKVMALLQILIVHRGQPLSQAQLIELVWPGQVVSDSSVYQAVAQLRKALGDTATEKHYIERISGKGYRLIADVTEVADASAAIEQQQLSPSQPKTISPLVALLVVVLILTGSWFFLQLNDKGQPLIEQQVPIATHNITSITLVALQNQTIQPNDALGALSHALLAQLTHIPDMKVVFVKTQPEQLKTMAVMTGKIEHQGDSVRVFLQLQNSADSSILWANAFQGATSDAFALQDQMTTALLSLFNRRQTATPFSTSRVNNRNFDQYLLARHLWDKRSEQSLQQAQQIFEQMRQQQQLFPLAAVGLCETYLFLHIYSDWSLDTALQKCQPLLEQTLSEQPTMGEALASKGLLLSSQHQKDEAAKLFAQAIQYAPNYAFGFMWYGNLARDMGDYERALALSQKAYELAPMSPVVNRSLAYSYLTISRFSDARYYYQRALTLDPSYFLKPVQALDFLPLNVSRAREFVLWQQQHPHLMAQQPYFQMTLAQIELALGEVIKAQTRVNGLASETINPGFLLYMKAAILSAKGDLLSAETLLFQRMQLHRDKRRFVMPYLVNLYHQQQFERAYQGLIEFAPTVVLSDVKITKDNQYLLAFYVYLQHKRGQLTAVEPLIQRLDDWFAQSQPPLDHYLAQWLVFRHQDAQQVLKNMLEQGWLPDHNEDMLALPIMHKVFQDTGIGGQWFEQTLAKNRAQVSELLP